MTNDKATRQAIYGALLRHVDKFGKYSDIQKTIDEVIDRLSELQPVNKADEEFINVLAELIAVNIGPIYHCKRTYKDLAREIASILPRREADKELLEALKGLVKRANKDHDNPYKTTIPKLQELVRSALSIAEREGKATNWEGFKMQCQKLL